METYFDDIQVVLEEDKLNNLKLFLYDNGKSLTRFSPEVPSILRHIYKKSFDYEPIDADLIGVLKSIDGDCPLWIRHTPSSDDQHHSSSRQPSELVEVRFDKTLVAETYLNFSKDTDGYFIKKEIVFPESAQDDCHFLGKNLVYDFTTKKIGVLDDSEATKTLSIIYDVYRRNKILSEKEVTEQTRRSSKGNFLYISEEDFKSLQQHLDLSSLSCVRFDFKDTAARGVDHIDAEYVVHVTDIGSRVVLNPVFKFNDGELPLDFNFWTLVGDVEETIRDSSHETLDLLPSVVLSILTKEFGAGSSHVSDDGENVTSEPDNASSRSVLHSVIKANLIDPIQQDIPNLNEVKFESDWALVRRDLSKELYIYFMMWWYFRSTLLFIKDQRSISVQKQVWKQATYDFVRALQLCGVAVFWQGKKIALGNVELSIDMSELDLNMFDIVPKVKINKTSLSLEELKSSILDWGSYEKEEDLIVFDQERQQLVLTMLTFFAKQKKGKDKNKSNIVFNRLQLLDILRLKKLGVGITIPEKYEYLLELLQDFSDLDAVPRSKLFKGSMRPYQKTGVNWLAFLFKFGLGGCLADDMGLGKTVQTIAFICAYQEGLITSKLCEDKRPIVIVVPPSLTYQWFSEIKKFYPKSNVLIYSDKSELKQLTELSILITSYEKIRREIDEFSKVSWSIIIFDEAQMIKNLATGRTLAARRLNGFFKLSLTGTPLENNVSDYYSIMDLVVPGILEDFNTFKTLMQKSDYFPVLVNRTKPFVLRRTKDFILKDLPDKVLQTVFLEMSSEQSKLYQYFLQEVRQVVKNAFRDHKKGQAKIIALTAILRLRQICLSPQLIDSSARDISPKLLFLARQVDTLKKEGYSGLIFSQFTSFLDLMEPVLDAEQINYLRMDGKTTQKKRKHLVETFQGAEEALFFLMSLKTGGVGLNLTKANYIFHMDPWWNPSVENQATDRSHRIGQTNKVFVSKIIMKDTIEEKILTIQQNKKALFDQVVDESLLNRSLTKDDLDYLIS